MTGAEHHQRPFFLFAQGFPGSFMTSLAQRLLPRFALLTVVLLYLVVLAGAIVRATGSGMGCPDWPKCYGRLIPPTEASQIDFSHLDIKKFQTAWERSGHPGALTEETLRNSFSAKATWIEFLNRCVGAISGLAALGTLVCALLVRPRSRRLILLLLGECALFGTVAWLGKKVVDTNLLPWQVTIHMALAVALITTALLARHWIKPGRAILIPPSLRWHLVAALALTLVQIFLGTQVREAVDNLAAGSCCDGRVEQHLGVPLVWHRVGAISVLTLVAIAFFRLKFSPPADAAAPVLITLLGLLVIAEYGAGVILVVAGLPALLQPVHLLMAVTLHGMLFSLLLRSRLQTPAVTPILVTA
jgi:cytochrome c oxidase assembly protein subunit 15